jgi:predicted HicB family RNase H-like nuclease
VSKQAEVYAQLATRIPKDLRRRLRLHCIETGVSVMEFVRHAIREKLDRVPASRGRR